MGQPSSQASNACIYTTYALFLVFGLYVAWKLRKQSKTEYLSSNRTQKGIPLALNFIAASSYLQIPTNTVQLDFPNPKLHWCGFTTGADWNGLGSGVLQTYPQIATVAGVQGLVVYALSSALPLLVFAWLGPIIRKKCPQGFVLTEWARQRYGIVCSLYLSAMTLITLFLYMVAELSAVQQIITLLTGLDGLPAVIVECVVTTAYTSLGGFKVSFITDNVQGAMVVVLVIIAVISVGVETKIQHHLIEESGYLNASLLGWQLIYILPVAIVTNDFFISGFWLRTFASRSDRDLWIGISIATVAVFIILILVGVSGLLAAWSGAYTLGAENGYLAFFLLLQQLPAWVVGISLVMVVALSTAAFDSFQSAMVSSGSNDLFRNKLNIWVIRASVVVLIVPVVVVALRSPNVLQIYLISDLVSAALVPVLVVGLWDKMYWWTGFEVVVGGLGGVFSIFLFGLVYYHGDALLAGQLILLEQGLYSHDWSAFGAFVAAPVGGILWALGALVLRLSFLWIRSKIRGERFSALDKPVVVQSLEDETEQEVSSEQEQSTEHEQIVTKNVQRPGKLGVA